ncbi:MAG: LysM peptidoglycan-binding domain-containing protein [Bacteriovoracia bacterium]
MIAILACMLCGPSLVMGDTGVHVVERGDALSSIAKRYLGSPVWRGRKGTLAKLLRLNPEIGNPDKIYLYQRIRVAEGFAQAVKVNIAPAKARPPAAKNETKRESKREIASLSPSQAEGFAPVSHLRLSAGFEYFRIDASDRSSGGSAIILSQMSPSLNAGWYLDWSSEWSTVMSLKYRRDRLFPIDSNSKTIQQDGASSFGFQMGVERSWNKNSMSGFFLGREDRLFVRALNAQTLVLDRVGVPSAAFRHKQTLVRGKGASAGVGASGGVLFGGGGPTNQTQTGWTGRGSAFLEHQLTSVMIRGELFFEQSYQGSSIVKQKTSTMGASIGFSWRLP